MAGFEPAGIAGHGIGLWLAKLIVDATLGTIDMQVTEQGRDISGRRLGQTQVTIKFFGDVG
jgi:hypothetical protein